MRRAALYARVSTALQEKEQTIDSQLAAITRYADEHGLRHSPALTYTDKGYSGTWLDRPALDELRDHVAAILDEIKASLKGIGYAV